MKAMLERFRTESAKAGEKRAGRKFSRDVQAIGAEYARARRADKQGWKAIADELGVAVPTLQRWVERNESAPGFRTVQVVESRPRGSYVAVLAGGLRVEGLELEAVVALARALS